MTIADHVLTSIEKTLLKTPAVYRYTEVLPRTFLATTGIKSWSHEDIFSKEPVRRMVIAMATNQAYLGTNCTNPFHCQKFNLSQIVVYRNGQPIVGTPVSTFFNHRIYFNTLEALNFLDYHIRHRWIVMEYVFFRKMYSFEILFLWSFCSGQFPKVNKRRIYHSQCFTVATCRKSLAGSFVSQKQSLFGRSAWSPDTKLPIIVFPTVKILQ